MQNGEVSSSRRVGKEEKSRHRNAESDISARIEQLAEDLSNMRLLSCMDKSTCSQGEQCMGVDGNIDRYKILPIQVCKVKGIADASQHIQSMPNLWKKKVESSSQSENKTTNLPSDCDGDWNASSDIDVYNEGDATSAGGLMTDLEALMSMWLDAHSMFIQEKFEQKKRDVFHSCFKKLGEWFDCNMREQARLLTDSLMRTQRFQICCIIALGKPCMGQQS